ncbi:MAG: hypothetical protein AVDCRST_MAG25-2216 [uncultured Rubrobacteraceae bacterium]|uniref:Uncharacterized protein n=1 Tax=uncultured Rubrobacteraceae bacterium TaxID=349277 RepID=A0A6J4RMS8_9ACTN|nr:MAG: hypothetical protein AVDCRST_MAG25-2216 [uncultured Rubrobacteraceae bacterium]
MGPRPSRTSSTITGRLYPAYGSIRTHRPAARVIGVQLPVTTQYPFLPR